MQWNSIQDFVAMGGYGTYVWSAYGVALAVIAIEVLLLRARHRAAVRGAQLAAQTEGRTS